MNNYTAYNPNFNWHTALWAALIVAAICFAIMPSCSSPPKEEGLTHTEKLQLKEDVMKKLRIDTTNQN